jgi:Predicted transcriptional regulator
MPGLNNGDTVLIDTSRTQPKDGRVFAINYEGELVIKRLMRDAGNWWLSSDNTDKTRYPNKLCAGDVCLIIGECVHKQSTVI